MARLTINGAYSKGFAGGYNHIMTPPAYSNYLRNCRIENNATIMRDWSRVHSGMWESWVFLKMKATEKNLYALIWEGNNTGLYRFLPTGKKRIGTIWTLTSADPSDLDIVAVWELLIILSRGNTPYWYTPEQWLNQFDRSQLPSKDWWSYPDGSFTASMGVFYSWFVFLNEVVDTTKKTNRIILSHEINLDRNREYWQKNATTFSQRKDADNLNIPYKIICPSTVQAMVATQQNLYIFCSDSVQYLDKELLMEYARSKTLRTLPMATGHQLMSKNMCVGAGNFVFFMSKDKHIRTIGYTTGIYDPQVWDITDTEFGIQRWIDDNIADDQTDAFAFFNKKDSTVEFHLKSKKWVRNDTVLIRDLQHKTWLIDSWREYNAMENCQWEWTATNGQWEERSGVANVVAGWVDGKFYYQTKDKYDTTTDDDKIVFKPIKFEHNTVNMAMWEIAQWKLYQWVRLSGAINVHTGNTDKPYQWVIALFEINVFVDGKQVCNKKVNWQQIYDDYKKQQIEVGWNAIPPYDPNNRNIVLMYDNLLFPFDIVLDQSMVRRKGKRIRVQVKSECPWSDLYLSWLAIDAVAIWNFDLSDKY